MKGVRPPADIGLGKDSHAIIGQNQVDTVLLASPAVRRGLIEEVEGLIDRAAEKVPHDLRFEDLNGYDASGRRIESSA